jgi:anti-anti-sigma regulatory factor
MILSNNPRVAIVRLSGAYDKARCADLQRELSEARGADVALLDVRDVTRIDAMCCISLVQLAKELRWVRGLWMVGAHGGIRRFLQMLGIHRSFVHYDSLKDAFHGLEVPQGRHHGSRS